MNDREQQHANRLHTREVEDEIYPLIPAIIEKVLICVHSQSWSKHKEASVMLQDPKDAALLAALFPPLPLFAIHNEGGCVSIKPTRKDEDRSYPILPYYYTTTDLNMLRKPTYDKHWYAMVGSVQVWFKLEDIGAIPADRPIAHSWITGTKTYTAHKPNGDAYQASHVQFMTTFFTDEFIPWNFAHEYRM